MKILLAVDGSEFSEAAIKALLSQFRPEGAHILVLRLVEPHIYSVAPQMSAGYAPEMDEVMKEELARAKERVEQTSQRLRAANFDVETRVAQAEARIGILEIATQWRPDLILLGSHGRRGLQRFLLGSVAEFVARHADCSVEIVRAAQT